MKTKAIYLILIGVLGQLSCGSSLGTKNMYYEYEKPSVQTDEGFINLTFNPSPRVTHEGNNEIVIWTKPYRFNTQYISVNGTFLRGEIRDLRIESVQSGEVVHKEELLVDAFTRRRPHDEHTKQQKQLVGFGAGPLEIPHHDYKVSFRFTIFSGNEIIYDQGEIAEIVKRKYFEDVK